MTVCQANPQIAKLFTEYNSTRRKKEKTVSAESSTRDRTGTGRTGRDAERVTHDATGNRTDERERRANSARRSGKMARAGRKRRADGARRTGKRYGRERNVERVARDRRDGGIEQAGDGKPQAIRREDQC